MSRTGWDRALVLSSIVAFVSTAVVSGQEPPPEPDHLWLFDEGQGDIVDDESGEFAGRFAAGQEPTFSEEVPFAYEGNRSVDLDGDVAVLARGRPGTGLRSTHPARAR